MAPAAPPERNRAFWGRYWPARSPKFYFKPVHLPADALRGMFGPAYRLPLYETALHDSLISLDRWALPLYKVDNVEATRTLLGIRYNTPINLLIDGTTLDAHGQRIAELQHFFRPLHEIAATRTLTGFAWLTPDRLVQRTTFGDGALTMTANFGTTTYLPRPPAGLRPGRPPRPAPAAALHLSSARRSSGRVHNRLPPAPGAAHSTAASWRRARAESRPTAAPGRTALGGYVDSLGGAVFPSAPSFTDFTPGQFPRPFPDIQS